MAYPRHGRSLTSETVDRNRATRLAVWALRSVVREHHGQAGWLDLEPEPLILRLEGAVVSLRNAHDLMVHHQGGGLRIAESECPLLSRDEWRVVRAATAAQAQDDALVDNLLFKLAPSRRIRPVLAGAVNELAATLGAAGHWLPPPAPLAQLPPPARPDTRPHGDFATCIPVRTSP